MALLDEVLGALLIGSWCNSSLFVLEVLQTVYYFTHYHNDSRLIKCTIVVAFAVDTSSTFTSFIWVYLYTITNWGNVLFLVPEHWPLVAYLITTACSATIVQVFLIHRYWSVSRQWIVTFLLSLLVLSAVGGAIGTTVLTINYIAFGRASNSRPLVLTWMISTAAANMCIALALVWELRKLKPTFRSTQGLIRRLTTSAVQTGLAPTVLATVGLVTYLHNSYSNVSLGIGFGLGRVYTLTMLFNLNMRRTRKNGDSSGSGGDMNTLQLSGIHVCSTAIVHVDESGKGRGRSFMIRNPESNGHQTLDQLSAETPDMKSANVTPDPLLDPYYGRAGKDVEAQIP